MAFVSLSPAVRARRNQKELSALRTDSYGTATRGSPLSAGLLSPSAARGLCTPSLVKTPETPSPIEHYLESVPSEEEVVKRGVLLKLLSGRVRRWEQREVVLTANKLCYYATCNRMGAKSSSICIAESIDLLKIDKISTERTPSFSSSGPFTNSQTKKSQVG